MIVIKNDPFALIISIVQKRYPHLKANIFFVDETPEKSCGAILIPDDESKKDGPLEIVINSGIPLSGATEVLAHELAHAVVGGKCSDDHGPEWSEVFEWINQEFLSEMQNIANNELGFSITPVEDTEENNEKPELRITLSQLISKLTKVKERFPGCDPQVHVLRPAENFERGNDFFPISDVDMVDGGTDETSTHYAIPVLLVNDEEATEINWN